MLITVLNTVTRLNIPSWNAENRFRPRSFYWTRIYLILLANRGRIQGADSGLGNGEYGEKDQERKG